MQKLLLSTVCRPFGGHGEGDSVGAELFHAQVTRSQGIFSLRQVIRGWGLDYIAENIKAPSVVLHYPSEGEFIKELKRGGYSHVGINFVVSTFHKARRMASLIRRYAPGARIIFGGYGTVLSDEELSPWCDEICREEGIGFMRRLLGDESQELRHPYAPIESPRVISFGYPTKIAHVTGGLGCPNGCDFCCTSHFFKRRHIPFAKSGRELHQALLSMEERARKAKDTLSGFIIIDEDFFLHESRAREFLDCVRERQEDRSIMAFGSIKGLSQFSADDIAEMGFDTIWTAFEGERAGYDKMKGVPIDELYESLKLRGVAILSSMILGFPYQDREQVMKEFDRLMSLGPTLTQILIYFAFPGTPLHQKVKEEDRHLPHYRENPDLRRFDGFSMHFKHPNFTAESLESLQRELYRKEYELLGPSIVRIARIWLESCRYLRSSSRPILRKRGERKASAVRGLLPALYAASKMGPNNDRRDDARDLLQEVCRELGPMTIGEKIFCGGSLVLGAWTALSTMLGVGQQPRLLRSEHRKPGEEAPCHGMRNQGEEGAILVLKQPVPEQ
jgi:hypothetical protein